ncbi:UNVERIFIED_CONTAM: hypothetical protein GTU68_065457 [Idotea baltica]|nr:hypothetical protein [Idotea baltica]
MTFGFQCDEAESVAIMDTAFDAGISFIDAADMYPNGHTGELAGDTERIIGRWMQASPGRRGDVVLASKFYAPMGKNPWDMGGSRKHILDAIDGSLERLQTDYLDLYQIHFWDHETPLDETLGALDDVVRAGKVRYIGCSNYAAWQLARAIGRSEAKDLVRYESVQPRYNLLFRNAERELFPLCEHDHVAVIPYNPLAGGFLTGRFEHGSQATRYRERYWAEDKFTVVEQMRPLAEAAGITMAQMAVGWTLANPAVTSPIVGASKPEQLADAIAATESPLDPTLKQELDDLTLHYRVVDAAR